jgi:uncharacterized protein (DUF488 family)
MKLAPTWKILNEFKVKNKTDPTFAERLYKDAYNNEILQFLNQKSVFNDLCQIYQGEDVVLLCYETPDKFCHRHLVAKWFYEAGIEVRELIKGV